jgi:ribosomal protein S18 acetylase RimI-like enzyme
VGLTLRPATAAEYDSWAPRLVAEYAALMVASGELPAEAAWRQARDDHEQALPAGLATPGQLIWRLIDGGQPVGWLWLAVASPHVDPDMAWVYLVQVDDEFRGRGYGRAAMLLAEAQARARGLHSIGLYVHGSNHAARSLYDSLGYQVVAQQMRKPL